MTVSLELDAEARRRGIASEFVPTGQTGIAIAGWGISVDAVVADFIAGAAEQLVLEGIDRGGRAPLGRGPGLAAASRLLGRHASGCSTARAPHALVLCHQAGQELRRRRRALPDAVALASSSSSTSARRCSPGPRRSSRSRSTRARSTRRPPARRSRRPRRRPGLPADDPVRFGAAEIADCGARARRPESTGGSAMTKLLAALACLGAALVAVRLGRRRAPDRRDQRRLGLRGVGAVVLHADDAVRRPDGERAHAPLGRHPADRRSTRRS